MAHTNSTDLSLYVLTDGLNSKIGVSINMDDRIPAYCTHNPNFTVHEVKVGLPADLARRIEAVVKACFKHLPSNTGKEWFQVSPAHMLRVVEFHLQSQSFDRDPLIIAAGAVPLTKKARALLSEVANAEQYDDTPRLAVMEEFGNAFGLGIAEHRLPSTVSIQESCIPTDIERCDQASQLALDRVRGRAQGLANDDHVRGFYHLVQLASGYAVALCTAQVSMPYRGVLRPMPEIVHNAEACGLRVFRHDKWSWHSPDKSWNQPTPKDTALLLYLQKTPIADRLRAWDGSFRKWVVENAKALEIETGYVDQIRDVAHDSTFPLRVASWDALHSGYIAKFYGWEAADDANDLRTEYETLFRLWRERNPLPPCPVPAY